MGNSAESAAIPLVRVIVPCRDEAKTVDKVVRELMAQPGVAEVIVVDNLSRDDTSAIARAAGATVVRESRPGKGYALVSGLREARRADYFVMIDGDDTYPADRLRDLIAEAEAGADMVIGTRLEQAQEGAFRSGHGLGNRLFIALVRVLFRLKTTDLFSGYRVLSSRFVEGVPLLARGFELELELSLQALSNGYRVAEVPVAYRSRPVGSASKLRTYADGARILRALLLFFRDYRPMMFFGALGLAFLVLSLAFGGLVIRQYLETGLVLRLPLAVLSAGLFMLSGLSITCGTILTSINRRAAELAALIGRRGTRSKGD